MRSRKCMKFMGSSEGGGSPTIYTNSLFHFSKYAKIKINCFMENGKRYAKTAEIYEIF